MLRDDGAYDLPELSLGFDEGVTVDSHIQGARDSVVVVDGRATRGRPSGLREVSRHANH